MSEINYIEKWLERGIHFLSTNKKRVLFVGGIGIAITIGGYTFFEYRKEKEKKLSYEINELERKLAEIENSKGSSLGNEENLSEAKKRLNTIYAENTSYDNGVRALFILAKIDYENNSYSNAREKFLILYNKNKKSYLAPFSLLYAAISYEMDEKFKEATDLLSQFDKNYRAHFLRGEALLALARNYQYDGQIENVEKTISTIEKDSDLNIYHGQAREIRDLLALQGLTKKNIIAPFSSPLGP